MALSSPVSPRDLALKEKQFHSLEEVEAAFNLMVRRLNEVYKYNRRDHDRLTQDIELTGAADGWFKLSAVAGNPMTGKQQTASSGSFSDAAGATNKSIYIHPGSDLANYAVNAYVFANFVGDSWVSVNLFSSDDEVIATLFHVCP